MMKVPLSSKPRKFNFEGHLSHYTIQKIKKPKKLLD
jgi:hypothetical protein